MEPFRCLFRVRYAGVDAQKIVFDSRRGEFTDAVVIQAAAARSPHRAAAVHQAQADAVPPRLPTAVQVNPQGHPPS
jgi:hypothetical protein